MKRFNLIFVMLIVLLALNVVSCDTITDLVGGGNTINYTVSFNANGGNGTAPSSQTVNAGSSVILPGQNNLRRDGYTTGGWNTKPDGMEINYPVNFPFTPTGDITLYVKWNNDIPPSPSHTVSFNANGGTGTVPATITVNDGSSITLPGRGNLVNDGYTFSGWNTQADCMGTNRPAGDSITPSGSFTLYAQWDPDPTARYETVSYTSTDNIVYSAHDDTNNYYVFLLGHINYVPLAYRAAIIYGGRTPIYIEYSKSNVTASSISTSVTEAYTRSVTVSTSLNWSISTEVGMKDDWLSAKVSETIGGSIGLDVTNTRSVANTFTTASSKAEEITSSVSYTIGNNDEPIGKYRWSLFVTTDVYYVLITDRNRTRVTNAYTAVCARPESSGWGIDYEPDVGGSFGKTMGGDLLTIPAIVLSGLPEPADERPILPPSGIEQTFDIRGKTSFSIGISSNISKAIIIGDNRKNTNSEIIVANRNSPLTIELQSVNATGKNGANGGTGITGGTGRPVIGMGDNMVNVPNLTLISKGSSNELQGGTGGNGGVGSYRSTGARGGNGGVAVMAGNITITGDANIAFIGGNGGNGGRGGDMGASFNGTSGGNGGNGGTSINANNITIDMLGIVYALRSSGGQGGAKWNGRYGTAVLKNPSDGNPGSQGASYTSTPRIINGILRESR
jgi:uncharacterized repeat protein (TIGR02543 family)